MAHVSERHATRTSFRGAKTCKIGKKCVFLVLVTKFGKDMTDKIIITKTHAKTRKGSIFIPEKYVFRGCFESHFTRISDIQPEIQVVPGIISLIKFFWSSRNRSFVFNQFFVYGTLMGVDYKSGRKYRGTGLDFEFQLV